MYQSITKTLPIEMTGLVLISQDDSLPTQGSSLKGKNYLIPELTIDEVMLRTQRELFSRPYPFFPDYTLVGTLKYYHHTKTHRAFEIDPTGNDVLMVSGLPKSCIEYSNGKWVYPERDRFRFHQNPSYLYYWEDNHIGYLTQVVPWSFFELTIENIL